MCGNFSKTAKKKEFSKNSNNSPSPRFLIEVNEGEYMWETIKQAWIWTSFLSELRVLSITIIQPIFEFSHLWFTQLCNSLRLTQKNHARKGEAVFQYM